MSRHGKEVCDRHDDGDAGFYTSFFRILSRLCRHLFPYIALLDIALQCWIKTTRLRSRHPEFSLACYLFFLSTREPHAVLPYGIFFAEYFSLFPFDNSPAAPDARLPQATAAQNLSYS